MESDRPLPPFLPETQAQFIEHVTTHPEGWFTYCQLAYQYIEKYGNTQEELELQALRLRTQIDEIEEQLRTANQDKVKLSSIIDFQKTQYSEQLQDATRRIIEAEVAKERALTLAQPAILLRERLRLLLPHLPSLLDNPKSSPTPRNSMANVPISAASSPRFTRRC